jgi:cell division protein ZapA
MAARAVEITVAGQRCRVVSSADERELGELARLVEDRVAKVVAPGRTLTTQAMLLVAIALAHELREAEGRADVIARRARASLEGMLARVDGALRESDALAQARASRRRPAACADADTPAPRDA